MTAAAPPSSDDIATADQRGEGRRLRTLGALAQARVENAWLRIGACAIVAVVAMSIVGNIWPLLWWGGLAAVLIADRMLFARLQRRLEEGRPTQARSYLVWIVTQSLYANLIAILLWFAPYVSGPTLSVIYLCGGLANTAATLRGSPALSIAGAAPTIAFLLGLPIVEYGMSGWRNPMLLMPLIAGLLLLGFGLNLWRSLVASDAAQARAEEAVIRERQAAAAAAAAKSDTIKRMNDELRTPMQALIGAAEHLRRVAGSPEARAHIATLVQAGEVLKLVLDDLSDLDQLENGLVRVTPKPADPRELARGVVSAFRAAAQDKHLELFLDVSRDTPAAVEIDAARVRQVLFNLLANAVRYTGHGGVRVSVGARAGQAPGMVQLYFIVADTGAGMSRAQLALIFGRTRPALSGEGPGLGLAISLRLARLMGGQLHAKSEPGQGSVFTLTLDAPLALATGRDAA